jgi:adenylate cyclase
MGTACAAAAWCLSFLPVMQTFDDWLFDGCVSWRGKRDSEAARQIVVVGLDEESFQQLGVPVQYISPKLAQVVKFLNSHEARAIGIDMLVPDYASAFPGIFPAPAREGAARDEGTLLGDTWPLREAVLEKGNVVFIQRLNGPEVIRPLSGWWFSPDYGPEKLACVELTEDRDFVARRQQLVFKVPAPGDRSSEVFCRHLTVALLELVRDAPSVLEHGRSLRLAGDDVPLDEEGRLAINFVGPPKTIRQIPFWKVQHQAETGDKVLSGEELDALRDAVIIIGFTTRVDGDRHLSPYANNLFGLRPDASQGLMDGPELNANTLATLWDREFIWTPSPFANAGIIGLTGVLLQVILTRLGMRRGILLVLAHHFGWKFVAIVALERSNLRLNLSGVLLTGALTYAAVIYQRWRWTRSLLSTLKSRELAAALEHDPGLFLLRGQERIVTVMFADIRNFSDHCRNHSPQAVVEMLNEYFTAIVPLIEQHHGTIDQYAGDGIKVVFNSLEQVHDHPLQAVKTAVRMVERVHQLVDLWRRHDFPSFRIGVGLYTGPVIVGAVGSPRRLDYTAIGDSVNAAARIESENKTLGTEILISAPTYESLMPKDRTELCCQPTAQEIEVKGVGRLRVYTVDVPVIGPL